MLQKLLKWSACNLNAHVVQHCMKVVITEVCGVVLNVICSIHICLKEAIAFIGSCA